MLHYINYYNPPYNRYQNQGWERDRAEALAARRARRAQYLPHEDVDSDEEYMFNPREKMYLDARRQEALRNERRCREEAALRYHQLVEEARRQEEMRRYIEEARQRQAAEIERNRREHMQHAQRPPSRDPSRNTSHRTTSPRPPHKEEASPTPAPAVEYSQVHHDAASKIQRRYRQQSALRAIDNIAARFEEARKNFTLPETIDFIDSSQPSVDEKTIALDTVPDASEAVKGILDVDSDVAVGDVSSNTIPQQEETSNTDAGEILKDTQPRLAYTKRNHSLHEYMEKLNVLLIKLDGVESSGSQKVRDRRKEVARSVEEEAARVETFVRTVWRERL